MKKILSLVILTLLTVSVFAIFGCGRRENLPVNQDNSNSSESTVFTTSEDKVIENERMTTAPIPTTPAVTVIVTNANEMFYRLYFEIGNQNVIPFRLFSCARIFQGLNFVNMDGVGVFPFKTDIYEEDFPLITAEKGKNASIYTDEFTEITSCAMYRKDDIKHENPVKTFTDTKNMDFSDIEKGEYYIMFDITRLGDSHFLGDEEFVDSYEYKCFVKVKIE